MSISSNSVPNYNLRLKNQFSSMDTPMVNRRACSSRPADEPRWVYSTVVLMIVPMV